jgi:hypothetical protein
MTELTLENIRTFLSNVNVNNYGQCSAPNIASINSSTITDIDQFLIALLPSASSTRKDNFLMLYNEQYFRNLEVVVGIFAISAVLGKMMFYPVVI